MEQDGRDLVLIVDDNQMNLQLLEAYLNAAGYRVEMAQEGKQAVARMQDGLDPDLVILDVMMPGMSGYDVCALIKTDPRTNRIPVMMLTALQDYDDKLQAFDAGADEFLSKPIEKLELLLRVKSLLRNKHLYEDLENARDVIYTLALAIEANDPYTRGHSERVAEYGAKLAGRMGMSEDQQNVIRNAGILHDIGKIGISETILQKPGRLSDAEWIMVQDHPVIGENICRPLRSANLLLTIIRHHQERFDGEGYPDHLDGENIPLEARIISVCDAFDAMTSPRPYRPSRTYEEAVDILRNEAGKQWDPDVVSHFLKLIEDESLEAERSAD